MTTVERIEQEIAKLSPKELAQFRAWYSSFDADSWDRQIEQDASAGKLNVLADIALQAHSAGKSKLL